MGIPMNRQVKRAVSFVRQLDDAGFRNFESDLVERQGLIGDSRRAKALRAFSTLDEACWGQYLRFARSLPRRNEDCHNPA